MNVRLSSGNVDFLVLTSAMKAKYLLLVLALKATSSPFSSDRQYVSYDGCVEVRGDIISYCSVLYCVLKVVHSHKHT